MTSNPFNEQVDLARQVLLAFTLDMLQPQVQAFADWFAEWKKTDDPLLEEYMRLNKEPSDPTHTARLQELRDCLDQHRNPWDLLLHTVPDYSADAHITRLVRDAYPEEQIPGLNVQRLCCIRCVRLSILHDRALPNDYPRLTEGILDREDVDDIWKQMSEDWLTWGPSLRYDIDRVKADLAQHTKEPVTGLPAPATDLPRARLPEIVEALNSWRQFNGKNTDTATRSSPEAKRAAREAMTLLVNNLPLLEECKKRYGCHTPLQSLFGWLEEAASRPDTEDLGGYRNWGEDFTQPKLWDGEERSFLDECIRWENRLAREPGTAVPGVKAVGGQRNQTGQGDGGVGNKPSKIAFEAWRLVVGMDRSQTDAAGLL